MAEGAGRENQGESMNQDLSELLKQWPYEPGQVTARLVTGSDGEQYIQLRLDLGILQMKLDGRPDGQRPNGYDSHLDAFEDQAQSMALDDEDEDGSLETDEETIGRDDQSPSQRFLTPEDCRVLRDESVQYYHRYLALLSIEDYDRAIRDTTRNLRLLDFCERHAIEASDRRALEQFRPYITMIRARALAGRALKENETKAAVVAIDEGLDALRRIFDDSDHPELFEASPEVRALQSMREALLPKLPVSQTSELRSRLAKAIEDENYELAAILRDEIRQIKE